MIVATTEYLMIERLIDRIPSPVDGVDYIPFTRFNSSEHASLRERGGAPYGTLQYLGYRPDRSRARRTARLCKHVTGTNKQQARIDRYPVPVIVTYQINLYSGKDNQRHNAIAQETLIRHFPDSFYAQIDVDIFGDGEVTKKSVHFNMVDSDYLNPLGHNQNYQTVIRYDAAIWVYYHTAQNADTFYNHAQVANTVVDQYSDVDDSDIDTTVQDTITLTP